MSGSFNEALLIGNVGRDPEIRSTKDGQKIANLSLATTESWKDRLSSERKERSEWHRIACYNENLVAVIEKYVRKGSKILVRGQIQTRKWTDNSGQDRYTTEVVPQRIRGELILLDSASGRGEARPARSPAHLDDDAPF